MGLRFVLISAYTHLACFFSHRITYYLRYLWPNIPQLVSSKASILCIQKLCLPFAIIVYKYVCSLSFCLCNKFKSYFFNDIYIPYASAGYEVRFLFIENDILFDSNMILHTLSITIETQALVQFITKS